MDEQPCASCVSTAGYDTAAHWLVNTVSQLISLQTCSTIQQRDHRRHHWDSTGSHSSLNSDTLAQTLPVTSAQRRCASPSWRNTTSCWCWRMEADTPFWKTTTWPCSMLAVLLCSCLTVTVVSSSWEHMNHYRTYSWLIAKVYVLARRILRVRGYIQSFIIIIFLHSVDDVKKKWH